MHWWKTHPPGWFAWDRWFEEGDEEGGDSGGGGDEEDDSGGDSGDSGDDSGGGDNGDSGGDSGDDSDSGDSDFGGDLDSDGDAGDDDAVQREWERDQQDQERAFQQNREEQDRRSEQDRQERENERIAAEAQRERDRLEEERRQQEERQRQEEAERQRESQVAEQRRLAEAYRTQGLQQQGVYFGDQGVEPPPVPRPEDVFRQQTEQTDTPEQPEQPSDSGYVILHDPRTGRDVRLPSAQLPQVTNLDEFEVRPDRANSPLTLQPGDEAPADAPARFGRTVGAILNPAQNATSDTKLPDATPQGLFSAGTAAPAPTAPEAAATNAAAAAAATGADPQTIAATAELAARTAADRQTLGDQSAWTRAAFRSEYGDSAEQEWLRQHNAELDRNVRLYGSQEPTAGTSPLSSAPAGTLAAPNRQIGAVSPPAPGESAQFGYPAQRPAPIPPAASLSPSSPAAAGPVSPTAVAPAAGTGWTPLPGQTARPASRAPSTLPGAPLVNATGPIGHAPIGDNYNRDSLNPATAAGSPGGPAPTTRYPVVSVPGPPPRAITAEEAAAYERGGINPATGDISVQETPGAIPSAPRESNRPVAGAAWEVREPLEPLDGRSFEGIPDDIARPGEEPYSGERGAGTAIPPPEVVTTLDQAIQSRTPIDALSSLALMGKGEAVIPENIRRDSYHLAQGISAMLAGNAEVTWPEPYLNDIARLGWAREESQNGRISDPRDAPVEYIEKWKDAFYGSDQRVPLVKELDQQMMDYAASRTPVGQQFNWQVAFGPSGDRGLISAQVTGVDCGPNAFSTILRSRGYNVDPGTAFKFARTTGYHNGSEFTGPANMVRMLNKEAGIDASMVGVKPDGTNWDQVDKEIAEGRPVILSSPDHYWVISAKNPQTGQYYAGKTTLYKNPEWLDRGGFRYNGRSVDQAIFSRGDVDPNSNAVRTMRIDPPRTGPADTRAFLSRQTLGTEPQAETMSAPATRSEGGMPRSYASNYEQKAYNAALRAGHPDPIEFVEQIRHESGDFDPNVITGKRASSAGAQGIIQIMPDVARSAKVDPYNVDQALDYAATRMTKNYQTYNGDSERALAEYNMGAGNLQRYGPRGLNETNKYIDIINAAKTRVKSGPISEASPDMNRAELLAYTSQPRGVGQRGVSLAERTGGAYSYSGAFQDDQTEPAEGTAPGSQSAFPFADDPRNRAAATEDVWSPRQPARQSLMMDYQQLPIEAREETFNRALDEGLEAEGITGDEKIRWKQALYEIASGTGRLQGVPGENPSFNPYMIAGEDRGTPGDATRLNSSATGYFQMIQTKPNGSDFAFQGYVPKEYNGDIYNPVAQVRQVVRAINASSNFRGNPDLAVADKRRKGHWDLVVQSTKPW